MASTTTVTGITRAQLISAVRTGRDIKGIGKMRALAALKQRGQKDLGPLLLEIVANRQELPRFRHMAAMGLYEMGGEPAREALAAAARRADDARAPAIAVGLGRVGTADSMRVVRRLESIAPPVAQGRLQFAATLLAYRHRLSGHDVRAIPASALQNLGRRRSQRIESRSARGAEANRALEALAHEPLDVDLTTERAIRIECEPNTFVWLWTKETANAGFAPLANEKSVAGVLFRKRLFVDAYALSAIGLATPMRGGVRLTLHRAATGTVVYAGTITTSGLLELKTRKLPGHAAVEIRAHVEAGIVTPVAARSAVAAPEARMPKSA